MKENSNIIPLVSIVLPVYNAEKFVKEAVDSILGQTYSNFELIIVNDCSTDNSEKIISEFNDHRIRYYKNEVNQKLVYTLNYAISLATGKYIARMDADDISKKERIDRQVEFLEKNPDIDVLGTDAEEIDSAGNVLRKKYGVVEKDEEIKYLMHLQCPLIHPSLMIKKEIFELYQYSETCLHAEDYDLWTRLALGSKKFANLKESLLLYRVHGKNVSNIHSEEQFLRTAEISRYYIAAFLKEELSLDETYSYLFPFRAKLNIINKQSFWIKQSKIGFHLYKTCNTSFIFFAKVLIKKYGVFIVLSLNKLNFLLLRRVLFTLFKTLILGFMHKKIRERF